MFNFVGDRRQSLPVRSRAPRGSIASNNSDSLLNQAVPSRRQSDIVPQERTIEDLLEEHDESDELDEEEEEQRQIEKQARKRKAYNATLSFAEEKFMEFEKLMAALSALSDGSDHYQEMLLNQAYTLGFENADSEIHLRIMAEAMHKRWLSDDLFPPIAANICYRLALLQVEDVSFRSIVLGLVYNDYKDRHSLRSINKSLFQNAIRFSFEYFRYFHANVFWKEVAAQAQDAAGATICKSDNVSIAAKTDAEFQNNTLLAPFNILIDPLVDYLFDLVNDSAIDSDIALLHQLLFLMGEYFHLLRPDRIFELFFNIRKFLVENGTLPKKYYALLMELVEIYNRNWNIELIPVRVRRLYSKHRPAKYNLVRWVEVPDI